MQCVALADVQSASVLCASHVVCCSVLQCVAACCSVLQRVAVCCSVLQCGVVWCSVLQCVAVRCSMLQCVAGCSIGGCPKCVSAMWNSHITIPATHCNCVESGYRHTLQHTATHCNTRQHTATHCNYVEKGYCTLTHCDYVENGYRNTLQHTATHCNTLRLRGEKISSHTATT